MSTQPPRPPTAWGMGKASQNAGRGTTKASWTWGLRTSKRSLSKMKTYLLNWKRWCARKPSVYSRPENRKR